MTQASIYQNYHIMTIAQTLRADRKRQSTEKLQSTGTSDWSCPKTTPTNVQFV